MFDIKIIVLFCISFYTSLTLYGIDCKGITQEELCPSNGKSEFKNFKVNAAFKVGEYIAFIGKLWRENKKEEDGIGVTVRVHHIGDKRDPSRDKPYPYFSARIWKEIQDINDKKEIKYIFSTDNMMILFTPQKMSEIVFVVQETNLTTAYQFDYNKIESSEEPTFNPMNDMKLVFNSSDGLDGTEYLNLKFLLIHFPYQLRIISIMIFDRIIQSKDTKYPIHYAIVYTEEMFEGKPYYFRHYMRGERHEYKDYKGKTNKFYRLDWSFDEAIDFCDELSRGPTAVVLLRKTETYIAYKEDYRLEFHFAEFYGTKHKIMKITFSAKDEKYVIQPEVEKSGDMDNAETLFNCKPHPIKLKSESIPCLDYPSEVREAAEKVFSSIFGSEDSDGKSSSMSSILFKFGLTLIVMAIVVLMCVGIYSIVSKSNIWKPIEPNSN